MNIVNIFCGAVYGFCFGLVVALIEEAMNELRRVGDREELISPMRNV